MSQMHNRPHPGEVLREWLDGQIVADAAIRIGINAAELSHVLNCAASISPEMDLRLSEALGTSPGLWCRMQTSFDLWQAGQHS